MEGQVPEASGTAICGKWQSQRCRCRTPKVCVFLAAFADWMAACPAVSAACLSGTGCSLFYGTELPFCPFPVKSFCRQPLSSGIDRPYCMAPRPFPGRGYSPGSVFLRGFPCGLPASLCRMDELPGLLFCLQRRRPRQLLWHSGGGIPYFRFSIPLFCFYIPDGRSLFSTALPVLSLHAVSLLFRFLKPFQVRFNVLHCLPDQRMVTVSRNYINLHLCNTARFIERSIGI